MSQYYQPAQPQYAAPQGAAINVGGRMIPGYTQAQRAVTDATAAVQRWPTLKLEAGLYTDNSGVSRELMKVGGLLPINFRGASYNIPVGVWVPAEYPTRPPTPYVTPTPQMDVVKGHQHVGGDGMCYFPYCNQWNQGSNVVGLVQCMQEAFSQHPPVTARAPGAAQTAPAPAPVPPPQIYQQPVQPRSAPAPAPVPAPAPAPAPGVGEEEQKVQARIVEAMNEKRTKLQEEYDELEADKQRLEAGRTQLDQGLQGLREEKDGLQRHLEWLHQQNAELQTWLDQHPADQIDPDKIVEAVDPLSAQLLEETAKDDAIDDTLYALQSAFSSKADETSDPAVQRTDLAHYLKEVQRLSKMQFRSKVLKEKIEERRQVIQASR